MNKLEELSRSEIEKAIHEWIIGRNAERDRRILSIYLFDGLTMAQMQRLLDAEGIELSIDRIKKIIRVRKEQLFRHL